jgi:multidrug efflux pump subunit AcrB
MVSPLDVETLPLSQITNDVTLMVRDVANVKVGNTPGQIDRISSQRYISISANVEDVDLGTASRLVQQAVKDAGTPPAGVLIDTRGQTGTMNQMFTSLGIGLSIAVCVILVMLTAYFQSPRLALTSIGAVPGVITGVVTALVLTKTTLNIESFMGSIMCIGVSVSNSVMMITFMNDRWKDGLTVTEAAVQGAAGRLRPIIMTACAMTTGMLPMALALEEGSQMQAPLGRAVIGGLLASTACTLLVLPAVFSILLGNRKPISVSIDPDDPEGTKFDGGDKHEHLHPENKSTDKAPTGTELA